MGLVAAKCTQCGSNIEVDESKEAGICPHCGTAFITEKAVHNYYNTVNNTYQNHIAQAHIDHAVFQDRESAESLAADFFKLYDLNERSAADRIKKKMYENYPQCGLTYLCSACSGKVTWIQLAESLPAHEKQTEIKDAYYFNPRCDCFIYIKQEVERAEKLMTPDEKQQFAGRLEDINEFCKQMQRRKEDYERLKEEEVKRRFAEAQEEQKREQEAKERRARQAKNKRTAQNIIFIVCLIGFILLVVFALSQCYNCLTDF